MSKITLAQKAQILSEVRKRAEDKFHTTMQEHDIDNAEASLEQDLLNLDS